MAAETEPADDLTCPPAWALSFVPGLSAQISPRLQQRLDGGSVNHVWRVDSQAGQFVLRLDGPAWRRPGVDRARELLLHRAAAAASIAPSVICSEPARGLMIMEYLPGRVWNAQDFADLQSLRLLGERLQALHALPVPTAARFDPWRVAQVYIGLIEQRTPDLPSEVLSQMRRLCLELTQDGMEARIVHGDLWQGNLVQGSRLWLLDWEYAQCSDPLMDLACVLAYYPAAERYREDFAAAAGCGQSALKGALDSRIYIYRCLSWLWHLARGEPAPLP